MAVTAVALMSTVATGSSHDPGTKVVAARLYSSRGRQRSIAAGSAAGSRRSHPSTVIRSRTVAMLGRSASGSSRTVPHTS